jgi:hypothetical protein
VKPISGLTEIGIGTTKPTYMYKRQVTGKSPEWDSLMLQEAGSQVNGENRGPRVIGRKIISRGIIARGITGRMITTGGNRIEYSKFIRNQTINLSLSS